MRIGSEEHKELFCRSFIASHIVYEPAELPWPELDETSLARLRGIPVWSMALQVELNAGAMVNGFAQTQSDQLVREAIRLQGYEEDRHARMIATLSDRYALNAVPTDPWSRPTRRAFIDFGYNECLDSFLGFGIFRLAREAEFLPPALTSLFARVLIEEARHIVFFVNWISYERARRGYGSPLLQAFPTAIGYIRALMKNIGRANAGTQQDTGFAAAGDIFAGLTLTKFLQACIVENGTYMATFDSRLLRPRVIPEIAKLALHFVESGSRFSEAARSRLARSS
ncbi:MAG: ferritin-like domain-containing protein [Vulcanimicrobiaceae bacterium]